MRIYTALFSAVAATAAQDAFELLAATGVPVEILAIELSQTSEVGDAQDENLLVTLKRGVGSTGGSGGTTPTPVPQVKGVTAAITVVKVNNTTQHAAGEGSLTSLSVHQMNVSSRLLITFPTGANPIVKPADYFIVSIPAPADSVIFSGTIWFRELQEVD